MRGVVVGSLLMALAPACAPSQAQSPEPQIFDGKPGPALRRFTSNAAFQRYVKSVRRRFEDHEPLPVPVPMAMPPVLAVAEPAADSAGAPAAPGNPEITNNQNVGVDEGGIVKQIGRHLVVLQDGRVFAVDLGKAVGDPLRLTGRIDVYRSEAKAASWYDEMLVLGDRVLVTAYSYGENASEITVLRLSPEGKLRREGRFLLSSSDYYSTENYATRLVGDSLVFYAPLPLDDGERFEWPRIRRAQGDGEAGRGDALLRATDVYAPPGKIDEPVLHTISVCPLKATLDCRTTAFVGAPMREFYVSPADAFLWIGAPDGMPWAVDYANRRRGACPAGQSRGETAPATLYRLPLDGGPVGAVAVDGTPADQFAFDSKAGRFRALLSDARRLPSPGSCRRPRLARHPALRLRAAIAPRRAACLCAGARHCRRPAREPLHRRLACLWRSRKLVEHGARRQPAPCLDAVRGAARRSPGGSPAGAAAQCRPHRTRRRRRRGHWLS
jgi:hypothetical protein